MTQTRRRFLTISAGFAALPVMGRGASALAPSWTGRALGAEATITLSGPADRTAPALRDALAVIRRMEQLFSLYDPNSDLSRLNADGALTDPDHDMAALMAVADAVHAATDGRFDPTVQPLWRALAEGRDTHAARAVLGWGRVRHGPDVITLGAGQALTFNGIAQGYATDRVQAILRAHGFDRTLVNIGEFAGDGGPWRLGVADPDFGIVLTRSLHSGAMATSSPRAMQIGAEGHILAPDGAAPHWSTVSVEADTAALADASSTALCMADRAAIARIKPRLPGLRRITAIDAAGNIATF